MSVIIKGGLSGNLADVDSSNNLKVTGSLTTAPATSGGLSFYSGQIGATVTAVKTSAGQLYGYDLYNNNSAQAYVQIFNKATGSVTLGTTVADMVIVLPANGGRNVFSDIGIPFSTAICFAVTTTRTGSSALANSADLNFFYK